MGCATTQADSVGTERLLDIPLVSGDEGRRRALGAWFQKEEKPDLVSFGMSENSATVHERDPSHKAPLFFPLGERNGLFCQEIKRKVASEKSWCQTARKTEVHLTTTPCSGSVRLRTAHA